MYKSAAERWQAYSSNTPLRLPLSFGLMYCFIVLLGRLPKVDLIIIEGENVCPYVRASVGPSTKSFFDFNEIWYIGRGR